jgi:hypothetical protein
MAFSKWFAGRGGGKRKQGKDEEGLTLSDVIRGIQFCVNSSVEIAEQHYATSIAKYVDEADKILSRRVFVRDGCAMDLPLICLTGHQSLQFDEMKVKMNVNIRNIDLKTASVGNLRGGGGDSAFEVSRGTFGVELGSPTPREGTTSVELEMKFRSAEPPEAMCRLIDQLNNSITLQFIEESQPE